MVVGVTTAALLGAGFVAVVAVTEFVAGVRGAAWTVVRTTLTVFVVGLVESLLWFRTGGWLIFAGDYVPVHAAGENTRGFAWGLVLLPFWWFPAGVVAAWLRQRRSWASSSRLRSMPPP